MLFCNKCKKEVVVYGLPPQADPFELDNLRNQAEKEGKLVLFNPPPIRPYNCPECGVQLEEK